MVSLPRKGVESAEDKWKVVAWVDVIAYNKTFASLKKLKFIQLANLLQARNSVLNTEIYSKWKKLFSVDVNSYVIGFLWGHNCRNVCSFPGTVLYLPKWSVEKADWPALTGCASGLIIVLLVGRLLLCPIRRTNSPYKLLLPVASSRVFHTAGGLSLVNMHSTFAWVSLRLWISGASWWLPTYASIIPMAHNVTCRSGPLLLSWLWVASRSACQRLSFLFLRMFFSFWFLCCTPLFLEKAFVSYLSLKAALMSQLKPLFVLAAISPYAWQLCLCLAAQDKQPCLQTTLSLNSLWILLQMTGHLCISRASDFCCP